MRPFASRKYSSIGFARINPRKMIGLCSSQRSAAIVGRPLVFYR
jgi:hypothetical protein